MHQIGAQPLGQVGTIEVLNEAQLQFVLRHLWMPLPVCPPGEGKGRARQRAGQRQTLFRAGLSQQLQVEPLDFRGGIAI